MPLTDTQKAEIKKHLGLLRSDGLLDSVFNKIDASADWLAEITTSLTLCNTRLTAYIQAKTDASDIVSAEGAVFNATVPISNKKGLYELELENLCRLVEADCISNNDTFGFVGY